MKTSRLFLSLQLACALAAICLTAARGAEAETATIKFSDPAKPGTLKLVVANGDIRVRGTDTTEVTVKTELKPEGAAQRKDGLRVLTSSSSYSLTEKDNVVSLSYGTDSWPTNGGRFEITVPSSTKVIVSNSFGGDIDIAGVSGDLEVKSLNGQVNLSDVSSGALVETMNGEIHVNVRSLMEKKPLSFSSMNGQVTLNLPSDAKASVSLRTHNGAILTDFDEKQLITKTAALRGESGYHAPRANAESADAAEIRAAVRDAVRVGMEAAREATRAARDAIHDARREAGDDDGETDEPAIPVPPMAPLPPMTGGKIVTGTLNGGGPEIRVTTMNGDVTLRKLPTS